jgi:hypothetical protein
MREGVGGRGSFMSDSPHWNARESPSVAVVLPLPERGAAIMRARVFARYPSGRNPRPLLRQIDRSQLASFEPKVGALPGTGWHRPYLWRLERSG